MVKEKVTMDPIFIGDTEEYAPNYRMHFNIVFDTDNQMRTIIHYKTFFTCMLEAGLVVEVF